MRMEDGVGGRTFGVQSLCLFDLIPNILPNDDMPALSLALFGGGEVVSAGGEMGRGGPFDEIWVEPAGPPLTTVMADTPDEDGVPAASAGGVGVMIPGRSL